MERELGGDFIVVGAPDHPLLLRPADVIVGGRSSLTAVMTPTVHEARRPEIFEARLTLNMMALPPNTKFVFVGREHLKFSAGRVFAAELSIDDSNWTRELLSISQQQSTYRQVGRAQKLQRICEARFADTYRLARVLQWRGRND